MGIQPKYKRGDVVYLQSSTSIGKLDSFKVYGSRQISAGRWVYDIDIGKKPPAKQLIGDMWDKRVNEGTLVYFEDELVTFCEAVDLAIKSIETKIVSVTAKIAALCAEDKPISSDGFTPKFEIDDTVYFDVSARNGFIQPARVIEIIEVGIQPGSKRARFTYRLDLFAKTVSELFFREDEIITLCEAYDKAKDNLETQLIELVAQKDSKCGI